MFCTVEQKEPLKLVTETEHPVHEDEFVTAQLELEWSSCDHQQISLRRSGLFLVCVALFFNQM